MSAAPPSAPLLMVLPLYPVGDLQIFPVWHCFQRVASSFVSLSTQCLSVLSVSQCVFCRRWKTSTIRLSRTIMRNTASNVLHPSESSTRTANLANVTKVPVATALRNELLLSDQSQLTKQTDRVRQSKAARACVQTTSRRCQRRVLAALGQI